MDRFNSLRSLALELFVLTAALVVGGCSSIPEVTFEDRDASAEDAGEIEGGTDALEDDYACPSRPPPKDIGVCCSVGGTSRLCLNCDSTEDCARCFVEGCSGTMSSGKVCCRKNSVRVTCDEAADCL